MRESILDLLQCPSGCDSGLNLTVESRTGDEIESGLLTCAGCRGIYCIREGIACLLPESLASPNGNPSIRTPLWAQSAIRNSLNYIRWAAWRTATGGRGRRTYSRLSRMSAGATTSTGTGSCSPQAIGLSSYRSCTERDSGSHHPTELAAGTNHIVSRELLV